MLGGFGALGDFRSQSVGGTFRGPSVPQEEVGRWVAQQEKETRRLQRPGSARLFPLPGRGHKYAVEIRGQLNGSAGPGHSELTLLWDRTGVPGGSVSTQTPWTC